MIYLRIRQPEEALVSAAMARSASQPSLLAYVLELIHTPEGNVPDLSEVKQGGLVVIMKTVIDVLDSAVYANR